MQPITMRMAVFGWLLGFIGWVAAAEPFALRLGVSGALDIPVAGAVADVLLLGQRADALPGSDSHDVPAPPAPPGDGIPVLFFVTSDPLTRQCWHDVRPLAASQAWELHLQGMSAGQTVTLAWQLDSGSLGGAPLRLLDRRSGALLVADMLSTTSIALADTDRALLIAYGTGSLPPLPSADTAFMLAADGTLSLPFAELLRNDDDPDRGDLLSVTDVGVPARLGSSPGPAGSSAYGSATHDAGNGRILYTLPVPVPADWTGAVAIGYTLQDNAAAGPRLAQSTVVLIAADDVVLEPVATALEVVPGAAATLAYTLRHNGNLHSLSLEVPMPLVGSGAMIGFWPFLNDYADDAATAAPTVDPGFGPDGLPGSADDTGLVRIDFGTAVPPSGTTLQFGVRPMGTTKGAQRLPALARYRLTADPATDREQLLAAVTLTVPAYSITFAATPGGSLEGDTAQTVEHGGSTTAVEARPAAGYRFVGWTLAGSAYSTANPLTLTGVSADLALTAEFALNTYTVSFAAGPGGSLSGTTPQTVAHGAAATAVEARPATGYSFVRWTLAGAAYSTANPLTVTSVTAPLALTAEFALNTYTVTFLAGPGGALTGVTVQTVAHGAATTPVLAVAAAGYAFAQWSDGSTANPRTLANVQGDQTLTAEFIAVVPVAPAGPFDLGFANPANPTGRKLWDFTGHYTCLLGVYTLTLNLDHDEKGALTGTGTLAGSLPGGTAVSVPLTLKGKAAAQNGATTAAISFSGKTANSSAKGKLTLTRSGTNLTGAFTASLSDKTGGKDAVSGTCTLPLPADMDGSFRLGVNLTLDAAKGAITGTGLLTLANGREVDLILKGKTKAGVTTLQASGDKAADPAFGAVKLTLGVTTLSNATGTIDTLSAKAFGQTLTWP